MKKTLLVINLFFLLVVASSAQTTHNVGMNIGEMFVPASMTIQEGDMVTWTNNDTDDHTSTSGPGCTANGIWNSGTVVPGATFSRVFPTAGTFPYHCTFHCSVGMVGTITVNTGGVSATKAPVASDIKMKSFPNPFTESATVEFELSQAGSVKVELYNTLGQKVTTALETSLGTGKHSVTIPASELKEGLYVCKLFLNDSPVSTSYMVKSGN